jgi:glyoxylate/hydroxypyruvate reductase A
MSVTRKDRRLLFIGAGERADDWVPAFAAQAPDVPFIVYEDGMDVGAFRYAIIWRPNPPVVTQLSNLEVIFGMGAGVERLLGDPSIPDRIPIVRMVEPGLTGGMVEYVLWQTIYHHRRIWELEEAQREARWVNQYYPAPWERQIGILGLGQLGSAAARLLVEYGFKVKGWSRSRKSVDEVKSFAGAEELPQFLEGVEILVCLLPLTADTQGIINAGVFNQLPMGSILINAARGGHLNEADLLQALGSGRLAAATLDVFHVEPLPEGHPFWLHPRIFMTPHNASLTHPATAAIEIKRQIERHESGLPLEHVADRNRGY